MRLNNSTKDLRRLRREISGFRTDVSRQFFEKLNGVVKGGCVSGFKLVDEHSWGAGDLVAKLLGFYEQQNHEIFEQSPKKTLVDLGAADGYWGVGLVHSGRFERSICFEQRRLGRRVIRRTAIANKVRDRVTIAGQATADSIRDALGTKHRPEDLFFLIDIEGGEYDLLSFDLLVEFRLSEFLIELHSGGEPLGAEKEERLLRDAGILFDCEIVDDTNRDLFQLRSELALPDDLTWLLVSEGRAYPMRWLHLKPRTTPAVSQISLRSHLDAGPSKFGTLWLGGELGVLERVCLLSMQAQGYKPRLFTYTPLTDVPEGIETFDAREIYEPNRVIRHAKHKSPAIHADVFRYHLVRKTGMIWLDTDMFMVKPAAELLASVEAHKGFCVGAVLSDTPENRSYHSFFNNAVFGFPKDSQSMAMLGEIFDEGRYVSDAWNGLDGLLALNAAVDQKETKPFGQLRWGMTGPIALSKALTVTGEDACAHDQSAFYNVMAKQMPRLAIAGSELSHFLTPSTYGLHLWGRDFRSAFATVKDRREQSALNDILELVR